jgi:hypothetical protein
MAYIRQTQKCRSGLRLQNSHWLRDNGARQSRLIEWMKSLIWATFGLFWVLIQPFFLCKKAFRRNLQIQKTGKRICYAFAYSECVTSNTERGKRNWNFLYFYANGLLIFFHSFVCFITNTPSFSYLFWPFFHSRSLTKRPVEYGRGREGGGVLHDGRPCWCLSSSNREWWWRPPWEIDLVSRDTVFRHHHKVILFYHEPSLLSLSLSSSLVFHTGTTLPLPTTATTKNSVVCSRL